MTIALILALWTLAALLVALGVWRFGAWLDRDQRRVTRWGREAVHDNEAARIADDEYREMLAGWDRYLAHKAANLEQQLAALRARKVGRRFALSRLAMRRCILATAARCCRRLGRWIVS